MSDKRYNMLRNPNCKLNDEIVTIESSDDEENCNNNNEERSPCKNRHNELDEEDEQMTEDQSKNAEDSDDEVIFVGDDTLELESISKIDTQSESFV